MERRNFLMSTGLFTAFSALSPIAMAATQNTSVVDPLKPVLLSGMTPLDPKGGMDIRVWMRTYMKNGLFSSVETAVTPKNYGSSATSSPGTRQNNVRC